tara:strand:- start:567 stop:773 length:207 start_codon:yes stop_codon:yes gene_type:complete
VSTPKLVPRKHVEYTPTGQLVRVKDIILWECGGCGFGFDAIHVNDDDSSYTCPVCDRSDQKIAKERAK